MGGINGNTKLMLHLNEDFTDVKGNTVTPNGDARISHVKFEGAIHFNGSNEYLKLEDSSDWDIVANSTEDWCIDFWVRFDGAPSGNPILISHQEDANNRWYLQYRNTDSNGFVLRSYTGGTPIVSTPSAGTLTSDEWHHVAVVKVASEYGIYYNGTQVSYLSDNSQGNYSGILSIGTLGAGLANFFKGWLEELRIQKSNPFTASPNSGLSDTITVPTAQHTVDSDTKLLLRESGHDEVDDISLYGHTVTAVGSPVITTAKFGNSSAFFDGTDDVITIPDSSDWDMWSSLSDDYTFDCWIYAKTISALDHIISQIAGEDDRWQFRLNNGKLNIIIRSGGSNEVNSSSVAVVSPNQWVHLAIIKTGSDLGLYMDGTQVFHHTLSSTMNISAPIYIGAYYDVPTTNYVNLFDGFMDEIRLIKSNPFTASPNSGLTDTITVPTAQHTLTEDTSLLMHFDNSFSDEAGDHPVSTSGSPTITESKLGNGSVKFNGTDQYLTIPDSSDWDILDSSSGNRTIDCWIYANDLTSTTHEIMGHGTDGNNFWDLSIKSDRTIRMQSRKFGTYDINTTSTETVPENEWVHIAMIKVGTDIGLYINGTQVAHDTLTSAMDFTGPLYIGRWLISGIWYFDGFMDEIRLIKSNPFTASPNSGLTDTITVPTAEYTSDANTKLLLHFNEDFSDDSGNSHSVTPQNDVRLDTYKFGSGAGSFDGSGDYLSIPDSSDWDLWDTSITNVTFDCWIRANTISGLDYIISQVQDSNNRWHLRLNNGTLNLTIRESGSNDVNTTLGSALNVDTWYHVAMIRTGTDLGIYLDGTQIFHHTLGVNYTLSSPLRIGTHDGTSDYFHGFIDEYRIHHANYFTASPNSGLTDTITVPTAEYTSDANTKLLLHFNDSIEDSSNVGHTVSVLNGTLLASYKFGSGALDLNGSTQYLTMPDSPDWDIFASNNNIYTIDYWIKVNDVGSTFVTISQAEDSANRWSVQHAGGSGVRVVLQDGAVTDKTSSLNSSGDITDSQWHHVAVCVIGNGSNQTIGIYLDGVQVSYAQGTTNDSFTAPLTIGQAGISSQYLDGLLDELRIQSSNVFSASPNGSLTDTITVPTDNHTPDADTKLLMHFDGNLNDEAGHTVTEVNNPTVDYAKFQAGSVYFDGTGDYLTIPDSSDWDILDSSSDNRTIDCWIYANDLTSTNHEIMGHGTDGNNFWNLNIRSDRTIRMQSRKFGTYDIDTTSTETVPENEWVHIAMIKVGTDIGLYINGTQVAHDTLTSAMNFTGPLYIGRWLNFGIRYFDGFMDEIRIQSSNVFSASPNGSLTDTITVPTAEYTQDVGLSRNQIIIIT